MKIVFNLEIPDEEAAFYGLYAGLRMYIERHGTSKTDPGFSYTAVAENYSRLEELKANFPDWHDRARKMYNHIET